MNIKKFDIIWATMPHGVVNAVHSAFKANLPTSSIENHNWSTHMKKNIFAKLMGALGSTPEKAYPIFTYDKDTQHLTVRFNHYKQKPIFCQDIHFNWPNELNKKSFVTNPDFVDLTVFYCVPMGETWIKSMKDLVVSIFHYNYITDCFPNLKMTGFGTGIVHIMIGCGEGDIETVIPKTNKMEKELNKEPKVKRKYTKRNPGHWDFDNAEKKVKLPKGFKLADGKATLQATTREGTPEFYTLLAIKVNRELQVEFEGKLNQLKSDEGRYFKALEALGFDTTKVSDTISSM